MPQKKTAKSKKPNLWTTIVVLKDNLKMARDLCPEGYIFQYWFNEYLRKKLEADLKAPKGKGK